MTTKKILIVEDEVELAEILSYLFTDAHWEVATALDGNLAMAEIVKFKPDVILSDINMPVKDGLQMLETLRDMQNPTPVIFLSGYRDTEKMKRAWAAGAYDFLDKPFKPESVLKIADSAAEFGRDYVEAARKRYKRMSDRAHSKTET